MQSSRNPSRRPSKEKASSTWTEVIDVISGETYFYNAHTGQREWTRPSDFITGDTNDEAFEFDVEDAEIQAMELQAQQSEENGFEVDDDDEEEDTFDAASIGVDVTSQSTLPSQNHAFSIVVSPPSLRAPLTFDEVKANQAAIPSSVSSASSTSSASSSSSSSELLSDPVVSSVSHEPLPISSHEPAPLSSSSSSSSLSSSSSSPSSSSSSPSSSDDSSFTDLPSPTSPLSPSSPTFVSPQPSPSPSASISSPLITQTATSAQEWEQTPARNRSSTFSPFTQRFSRKKRVKHPSMDQAELRKSALPESPSSPSSLDATRTSTSPLSTLKSTSPQDSTKADSKSRRFLKALLVGLKVGHHDKPAIEPEHEDEEEKKQQQEAEAKVKEGEAEAVPEPKGWQPGLTDDGQLFVRSRYVCFSSLGSSS